MNIVINFAGVAIKSQWVNRTFHTLPCLPSEKHINLLFVVCIKTPKPPLAVKALVKTAILAYISPFSLPVRRVGICLSILP